jgi:hypothetical protein
MSDEHRKSVYKDMRESLSANAATVVAATAIAKVGLNVLEKAHPGLAVASAALNSRLYQGAALSGGALASRTAAEHVNLAKMYDEPDQNLSTAETAALMAPVVPTVMAVAGFGKMAMFAGRAIVGRGAVAALPMLGPVGVAAFAGINTVQAVKAIKAAKNSGVFNRTYKTGKKAGKTETVKRR